MTDYQVLPLPEKNLYRPSEVASYLNISVKTVYFWIQIGKLEAVRIGDRYIRIPREAILSIQKPIE